MSIQHGITSVADMVDHKTATKEAIQRDEDRKKQLKQDISLAANRYYASSEEDQLAQRKKKDYTPDQQIQGAPVALSLHQRKSHMYSVRGSIERRLNRDVYSAYDAKMQKTDPVDRKLDLHHARGTVLREDGNATLTINVAGSSFKQFRSEQSGFKGKGGETKTESDLQRFEKVYGKPVWRFLHTLFFPTGALLKEKLHGAKRSLKYTLQGPGWFGGLLDGGHHGMSNIREYINEVGQEFLIPIFKSWEKTTARKDLHIILQGHSRGAAALARAARDLVEWAKKTYPGKDYYKYVKVESVQLDPVPGPDNRNADFNEVDLRPVKEQVKTTTVYSIHTEHSFGFTPQLVRGQNAIVLMAEKHGVGLDTVDGTQMKYDRKEKYHKPAYVDAAGLEAYRGSGLTDLPPGVYFRDENNALVRIRNYQEAVSVMREVLKETKGQEERREVIMKAVRAWFIDNDFVDPAETEAEMKKEYNWALSRVPVLEKDADELPMTDEIWKLYMEANPLITMSGFPFNADSAKRISLQLGRSIDSSKAFLEKVLQKSMTEKLTQPEMQREEEVSQMLSAFRSVKSYLDHATDPVFSANQGKTFEQVFER